MPRTKTSPTDAPDPIDVAVGARIRLQRQARGMSQQTLGERLGVSFQQVQKYERAGNRVSASMLVRAAEALDCSPMVLLTGSEDQTAAGEVLWLHMLTQPGARELLAAFTNIEDPAARAGVIAVAKGLAGASARPRACEG